MQSKIKFDFGEKNQNTGRLLQVCWPSYGIYASLDTLCLFLLQVFSFIFTVASRLLHLYSTDDKTSRLMLKFLHSEGHPERYTELHGEEGGGRYR